MLYGTDNVTVDDEERLEDEGCKFRAFYTIGGAAKTRRVFIGSPTWFSARELALGALLEKVEGEWVKEFGSYRVEVVDLGFGVSKFYPALFGYR